MGKRKARGVQGDGRGEEEFAGDEERDVGKRERERDHMRWKLKRPMKEREKMRETQGVEEMRERGQKRRERLRERHGKERDG